MWDGFNKRKFPRLNLQCEITIRSDEKKGSIKTITENLGAGGVCVMMGQSLERFSKCRVKLHLKSKSTAVECDGKVVWVVPTRTPKSSKKRFDVGIEFEDISPEDLDKIRKFVEAQVVKQKPRKKPSLT